MAEKTEKILEKFASSDPLSQTNNKTCRICLEGDGSENLLSPCKCTGTVALIHKTCLENWLTSSNATQCEICSHMYKTKREPRTFQNYIRDSSIQKYGKSLIVDVVCFLILTPLIVVLIYLCSFGANEFFVYNRTESFGLILVALFFLGGYCMWCHITIKYHRKLRTELKNQQVRLVEYAEERNDQQNIQLI